MKYFFALLFVLNLAFLSVPAWAYHDTYDGLLGDYVAPVTAGGITYNGVDYAAWGQDARHKEIMAEILNTDPATLTSKNDKLTY